MKDSILKGAGNSRFLKSAVPAGTSWADALAMLQAGTFPIDFNGINAEGFQQVGTPLNKANLLKDATAAQIGLPPSTTPDGMFQALGNTGELHVWRKTVVKTEPTPEVPAGYTLGTRTNGYIYKQTVAGNSTITFHYGTSIKVSNAGVVSIVNYSTGSTGSTDTSIISQLGKMAGKFLQISVTGPEKYETLVTDIVYIPSDATITVKASGNTMQIYMFTDYQVVSGYPYTPEIPAGTTTTYPVSTNPNAYQEGDDAKPAGYVLGDTITGKFVTGGSTSAQIVYWNCSSTIEVHNDGNLALISPTTYQIYADNKSAVRALLGKFAVVTNGENYISGSPFAQKQIVYIPSDAVVDTNRMSIDCYQPVTGYPAIPAGTTIEYLGKLGDKARVQVVSYVGTGTSGSGNPNSLTFDFAPKVVIVNGHHITPSYTNSYSIILSPQSGDGVSMLGSDRGYVYCVICEATDRTVSWYAADYSRQLNESGMKYVAVAIG